VTRGRYVRFTRCLASLGASVSRVYVPDDRTKSHETEEKHGTVQFLLVRALGRFKSGNVRESRRVIGGPWGIDRRPGDVTTRGGSLFLVADRPEAHPALEGAGCHHDGDRVPLSANMSETPIFPEFSVRG
jgi:hypothetical protein